MAKKRYVRCATCGKKIYKNFYFLSFDAYCSQKCIMQMPEVEHVESADELIDSLDNGYFDNDGYKA